MKAWLEKVKTSYIPSMAIVLVAILMLMAAFSGREVQGNEMTSLEKRISKTLSSMEGAGQVDVVIRVRKQGVQSTALSAKTQGEEIPCGAIAVAQGADDPMVRLQLTQALCALLGLQASQVEVMGINGR